MTLCKRPTACSKQTSGFKITAGQRTMSVLIAYLTGQTLILPVILTGHFWMRTFYNIFHKVVAQCVLLYNAVMIFFLWLFSLLGTNPFKEKERRNKFHVVIAVMKCNKAKQHQSELWSNATMQQVVLYVLHCCDQ